MFGGILRYLADRTATASLKADTPSENVTDFLGRHLLAIFTKLNDPLRAENVAPKRQALETLIFLIGCVKRMMVALALRIHAVCSLAGVLCLSDLCLAYPVSADT